MSNFSLTVKNLFFEINSINKDFLTYSQTLSEIWKGPSSIKYQNDIKEALNICTNLKVQIGILLNISNSIVGLEDTIKEINKNEIERNNCIDETILTRIESNLLELNNKKNVLFNNIKIELNNIINLKYGNNIEESKFNADLLNTSFFAKKLNVFSNFNTFSLKNESDSNNITNPSSKIITASDGEGLFVYDSGYCSPVPGRVKDYGITSNYGPRNTGIKGASSYHKGIDIATPYGTPCYATCGGEILEAGDGGGGFGRWVVVRQDDGNVATYGHISDVFVKPGDRVITGQKICNSGNAGIGNGPHLHYQLNSGSNYDNSTTFNPCTEKLMTKEA